MYLLRVQVEALRGAGTPNATTLALKMGDQPGEPAAATSAHSLAPDARLQQASRKRLSSVVIFGSCS